MRDLFPEVRVDPTVDLDRRYTTPSTMRHCMGLAGVEEFDLDVAADEESHWAPRWFSVKENGLEQDWRGRVWANPPYSDIAPWVKKAWSEAHRCDVIAMLLPSNRTEQPWWQVDVERFRDGNAERNWKRLHLEADSRFSALAPRLTTHFLASRIRFGHPGNPAGHNVGSPPFGCVLLVWRRS